MVMCFNHNVHVLKGFLELPCIARLPGETVFRRSEWESNTPSSCSSEWGYGASSRVRRVFEGIQGIFAPHELRGYQLLMFVPVISILEDSFIVVRK
jgi:hypothetical protein